MTRQLGRSVGVLILLAAAVLALAPLVTCTMSGYAFAMVRFRGRNALFGLIMATMMVPLQIYPTAPPPWTLEVDGVPADAVRVWRLGSG
jgi:ABC-type glycerol-3-phosphate transport system permease component